MGDGGFNVSLRYSYKYLYSQLGRLNLSRANATISTHDQPASRNRLCGMYGIKPPLPYLESHAIHEGYI